MTAISIWMEAAPAVQVKPESVSTDDAQDIRQSLSGDEQAYARLIGRYQSVIAAQMWRYSRDPRIVEELVQEVFVEVYTSLKNYRAKAPFLHWVRRIATRVGYRHWKHKSREQTRREKLDRERDSFKVAEIESPTEAAEYTYTLLEQLPAADRLVLTLLYFEEGHTEEIARRTGWSRSLVKVRAFRARKKLRALLEEAGYGRPESA